MLQDLAWGHTVVSPGDNPLRAGPHHPAEMVRWFTMATPRAPEATIVQPTLNFEPGRRERSLRPSVRLLQNVENKLLLTMLGIIIMAVITSWAWATA